MARTKAIRFDNCRPTGQTFDLSFVQLLHDRSHRDKTGLFWAEGCRNLHSAMESGSAIECIVRCRSLLRSRQTELAIHHLCRLGTSVLDVSEVQFLSLSTHQEPQGVGIVARQSWQPLIQVSPAKDDVWIVLDNVRTPGNLGTILRTSAAVGAQGVMLIGGLIDPHDPASIRASMGAIFHQRLVRTSAKALLGWRKRHPCHVLGTSPRARTHYRAASYAKPLLLMMGNERTGLRTKQHDLCDTTVRLPMTDKVDSLNLAVATGILLYEAMCSRRC